MQQPLSIGDALDQLGEHAATEHGRALAARLAATRRLALGVRRSVGQAELVGRRTQLRDERVVRRERRCRLQPRTSAVFGSDGGGRG